VIRGLEPKEARFLRRIPLLPPLARIRPAKRGLGDKGGREELLPFGEQSTGASFGSGIRR